MAPRLVAAVLMVLFTACAAPHAIRLDTGAGSPREYRPPTSGKSVKVSAEAFEEAPAQLVLDTPLSLRSSQHGAWVHASYPRNDEGARWRRLMRKSFHGLCAAGQRGAHCLSL